MPITIAFPFSDNFENFPISAYIPYGKSLDNKVLNPIYTMVGAVVVIIVW